MAKTVVSLSSSYTELFWNTSCFFQKGQSSGIATYGLVSVPDSSRTAEESGAEESGTETTYGPACIDYSLHRL